MYNKETLNIVLNKMTKQEIIEKLSTIIEDYNIDVDKYFVVNTEISTDVKEVFDYYNNFNIKKQRELDTKLITLIKKSITLYEKENLLKYIRRYNLVLKDEKYYFSYKWNLTEFLSRKEGISSFTDNGDKWLNYLAKRPIVDTNIYFDAIWSFYPNKQNKETSKFEFDKKFIGINNTIIAKSKAQDIYIKVKEYISECDEDYIKTFENWLKGNMENGK